MKRLIVILIGGLVAAWIIFAAITVLWNCPKAWCYSEGGPEESLKSETEMMQTAMDAVMAGQSIKTVTPNDNTTGSLGVNTWTSLPAGPDAAPLDGLLGRTTTRFYYCWDSGGNVYAQNKKDGVIAGPKDAEEQRPCKKAPLDPS